MGRTAAEKLQDNGIDEDVLLIDDDAYGNALVGVVLDDDGYRAVYNYNMMVEGLVEKNGWQAEEAMEWIDYNVVRALPYYGKEAPIIFLPLE